jgi:hypothetical protein
LAASALQNYFIHIYSYPQDFSYPYALYFKYLFSILFPLPWVAITYYLAYKKRGTLWLTLNFLYILYYETTSFFNGSWEFVPWRFLIPCLGAEFLFLIASALLFNLNTKDDVKGTA